jgi:hypothetical protein
LDSTLSFHGSVIFFANRFCCCFNYTFNTSWIEKIVDFSVNGVLCYFPPSAVLQGNARLFGRKVDKAKVEVRMEWKIFLQRHLKKNYVAIWSCMKLEDVLEVLSLFML